MYVRSLRRASLLLVVALLLAALIPVQAGSFGPFGNVTSDINCSSASVSLEVFFALRQIPDYFVELSLYIDGSLTDSAIVPITPGVISHTFTYATPLTGIHTVDIYAATLMTLAQRGETRAVASPIATANLDCTTPVSVKSDGRFCFAPGTAPAALYTFTDAAGKTGLRVYAIDASDKGEKVIELDSAELAAFPNNPDETIMIADGLFNGIKLYKLPSSAYQINVNDARVAKVHVCEFNSVPPTRVKVYTVP
jgi:hypothetical protein